MNRLIPFFLYIILLFSCTQESREESSVEYLTVDISKMEKGHVQIKITEDFAANLEQQADQMGRITSTMVESSDDILSSLGVEYMQRVFPPAGRFEARTRKEGLHLWYDVYFDNNTLLTKAKTDISEIEGVSYVEYVPRIVPIRSNLMQIIDVASRATRTNTTPYFDDPLLGEQWHYQNPGIRPMSIKGSDINVVPVWENHVADNSTVIVSIVDGGIDILHEDLADNIWINYAELNGVSGQDDNGTGAVYIDDIHGWNFVNESAIITPDEHGTHVAGIVGAVNNNGKGISGIAGGDAKEGIKGVRLMSCQIFDGDRTGSGIEAIKYAADAGAIISQNSWAYDNINYVPGPLKVAVDYFVKYAGVDKDGNQVGPMKGGIVIFAAGNENEGIASPSMYDGVMSVAAIDASFKRTVYSNYGDWVDIAAPGGATEDQHFIISTLPSNKYGGMEGTSMACPHVSGVAALLVSHFGGPGFTNQQLWNKLLFTANNVIYDYDSRFIGNGLLDAEASFLAISTTPPNKVTDLISLTVSNRIDLEYTIPSDLDDTKLHQTNIYYSKLPIPNNLDRYNLPDDVFTINFKLVNYDVGSKFSCKILNLDFNTKYYITVDTEDKSRNKSELSEIAEIMIGSNNAPEIILAHDDLILNINDQTYKADLTKYFYDQDEEVLKYTVTSSNREILSSQIKQDSIFYTFTKVGSTNIKIVARDNFGGAASITFEMLIRDMEKEIDIYPNPVFNILNLRMGEEQDAIVSIYEASGSMCLQKEVLISPFAPAQIDLTGLNGGKYVIVVNYDDKEIRKNIVKL